MWLPILSLCLACTACSLPESKWRYEAIMTNAKHYSVERIVYQPEELQRPFGLELRGDLDEVKLFVNLPYPRDVHSLNVRLNFGTESVDSVCSVFDGGQRIQIPSEMTKKIMEILAASETFKLIVGRSSFSVDSEGFKKEFKKFERSRLGRYRAKKETLTKKKS